jgi:hypothetical protein
MEPRIYTYKITFEEVPHWYWGVHKESKFKEAYMGSPKAHKWMWEFYTPRITILETFPRTTKGWEEAQQAEKRLIKPDLNNPLCLNENCGGLLSVESCQKGAQVTLERLHSQKDEAGRSLHGVKSIVNLQDIHNEKNEQGKSRHAVKAGQATHREKDELGRSKHGLKSAERIHAIKDDKGRSVVAVSSMEKVNAQKYMCTVTGHVSNAGGLSRYQIKRGIDTSLRLRLDDSF